MRSPGGPLRLGLLLDEPKIPWWIAPAIQAAEQRGIATVELAVLRREPASAPPRPPRPLLWWRNRRTLGYALLDRLDRARARRDPLPSDWPLEAGYPSVARLEVVPQTTRFSDRLTESDVAAVRERRLDLLIRIGFRILRGPILDAARHGTWSFHHGDNRRYRGGPPGVWEVLEDQSESGVTLQRLTEDLDGGEVLAWVVCATRRFSFEQNFRSLLRRSSPMLLTSLERLQREQSPVQASAQDPGWDGYGHRLYRAPTNVELRRSVPRLLGRYLAQRARSAGRTLQWSLGWHYAETAEPERPHGVMHQYREIHPPRDRFWADPFVVREGGRWWMFFEEYRYTEPRGEIALWEMAPTGPVGAPRIVFRRPYHLSYPQVFRHEHQWYLLPETAAEKRVELYAARRFPDDWELRSVLLSDLKAVDATVLLSGGQWYLFATVADALHAFVAPRLDGPYVPHPENPLVTDVRWARPAGRFFRANGRLFRPAQRGSPFYGAGLALAEVTELTPTSYRERVVRRIDPDWDPKLLGIHTLNAAEGLSVVDFLRLARL